MLIRSLSFLKAAFSRAFWLSGIFARFGKKQYFHQASEVAQK
jgi:hypothetical protein